MLTDMGLQFSSELMAESEPVAVHVPVYYDTLSPNVQRVGRTF